jgi:predicted RNA-binding Zn-ribbon protein involved in translation (DUF1610 family)
MASVSQLNPYQCDQCGTTNIVAAPVLYQQGTRAYSGTFSSGTSQSFSAQAAAPPDPRGYAKSIMDYIFRWLELRFLSTEQLTLFSGGRSGTSAGGELKPGRVDDSQFILDMGDAPPCVACGGLMKPSGACYTCINCGQTSGCS